MQKKSGQSHWIKKSLDTAEELLMPEDKKDYTSDASRTGSQMADSDRQKLLEDAQRALSDNGDFPSGGTHS
jgi:hypothetical protein